MTMQSDVKVTKPLTTTGVFKTQSNADFTFRGRVKGIYIQNGVSAGSVIVADGQGETYCLPLIRPPLLTRVTYTSQSRTKVS